MSVGIRHPRSRIYRILTRDLLRHSLLGVHPSASSEHEADMMEISLAVISAFAAMQASVRPAGDTLRLEVGSAQIDGRVFAPHAARVRVYVGDDRRLSAEWTNELTLGDSATRPVMRWVTRGTRYPAAGNPITWELLQTYDAVTLAPYRYTSTSSQGASTRLTIDGRRIRGTRRQPGDTAAQAVDQLLDRAGFFAGASDLVPVAVGLEKGAVMTAPFWSPGMSVAELRIFSVIDKVSVNVEGADVTAWKVEEHRASDRRLLATWYLLTESPYMVYGEVVLPSGQVQRMTEVAIPK